jgi:WD40 repeat protein
MKRAQVLSGVVLAYVTLMLIGGSMPRGAAALAMTSTPGAARQVITASNAHRLKEIARLQCDLLCYRVFWLFDNNILVEENDEIRVVAIDSLATLRVLSRPHGTNDIAINRDRNLVALSDHNGTVELWDLSTANSTLVERYENSIHLTFSPNGTLLLIRDINAQKLILYDLTSHEVRLALTNVGHEVVFSPSRDLLAVEDSQDSIIALWNVFAAKEGVVLDNRENYVNGVDFDPESTILAVGGIDGVVLWDILSGKRKAFLEFKNVASVLFSPDGTLLAVGNISNTIKLWSVNTGRMLTTLEDSLTSYTEQYWWLFKKDGTILISYTTSHPERLTQVWDVTTGKVISTLNGMYYPALRPDETMLATSDEENVVIWGIE